MRTIIIPDILDHKTDIFLSSLQTTIQNLDHSTTGHGLFQYQTFPVFKWLLYFYKIPFQLQNHSGQVYGLFGRFQCRFRTKSQKQEFLFPEPESKYMLTGSVTCLLPLKLCTLKVSVFGLYPDFRRPITVFSKKDCKEFPGINLMNLLTRLVKTSFKEYTCLL